MNPYYRKATIQDALYVAKNMRVEDRKEVEGLGHTPGILPWCVINSINSVVFYDKDHPNDRMGVAGIMPDEQNPRAGIVWMICTPHITNKPLLFVSKEVDRNSRKWI